MRPSRESFGVGVATDVEQDGRGEQNGPTVAEQSFEREATTDEDSGSGEEKDIGRSLGEFPGGQSSRGCSRIAGVYRCIDDAIESHGHTARGDHANNDKRELRPMWPMGREVPAGQESRHQGEGQCEDGVGQFDHIRPNARFGDDGAH